MTRLFKTNEQKKRPKFFTFGLTKLNWEEIDLSPVAMGEKLITLGLKNHDGTPHKSFNAWILPV